MSFTVAARGIGNTVTKTKQIKGQSPRPKSCSWCGPSISRVSSNDPGSFRRPAVARIGATLWNWSDEIEIFNPVREQAYGVYMHEIGCDHINPDIPPMEDPAKPEHNGWAYGAFILKRFTEWNATTRELGIYYLLSLSSPYQVQLMYARLRVD